MRRGYIKILRDLKRNLGRTVLAVLSIAIGVFAVGINSGMMDLMPSRMLSSYQATNPAHVRLWLDGIVDDDQIARLAREPGIAGVEGVLTLGARWRLTPDQQWRDMSLNVRSDYAQQQFNTVALVSGAWPAKNVVAVEEATMEYFGIQPGSTLTLLINEREHEVKVGGVIKDITGNMPAFGGNAAIFISPEMAEDIWGWRGYTALLAQVPQYSEADRAGRRRAVEGHAGKDERVGVFLSHV